MNGHPSPDPVPKRRLAPASFPRAVRAQLWTSAFLGVSLFVAPSIGWLVTTRPLIDPRWVWIVAALGGLIAMLLCWTASRAARGLRYPLLLGSLFGFACVACMIVLIWPGLPQMFDARTASAFLDQQPSAASILKWNQDVAVWCIGLQAQPADAARAKRAALLAEALEPVFAAGDFVPHETVAAAVDAGALTPRVAAALLTSPHHRAEPELVPTPAESANSWLKTRYGNNPGDGQEYATALAVHLLCPALQGFDELMDAALERDLPPPGTDHAVSDLRNAVVLAESLGLHARSAALCECVGPTLRAAWVDNMRYRYRDVGFQGYPGEDLRVPDALETHAALELMTRCGIPAGIDISRLRQGLAWRSSDQNRHDEAGPFLAALDMRLIDETWPAESRPRPGPSDVLILALVGLIAWSVHDIRRKPLTAPMPA